MSIRLNIWVFAALTGCLWTGIVRGQAGPDYNPQKRYDCNRAGYIKNDRGRCVPIEEYLDGKHSYWVDQESGSDANPGSRDRPFKTIGRATQKGQLVAGDVVIVREGLYRESIRPIVGRVAFAAYPGERVIVSGADPASEGWTRFKENIYRRAYTTRLPTGCPFKNCTGFGWRRELLVANGDILDRVGSVDALQKPGTFFVDGNATKFAQDPPRWMYAHFPGSRSPENVTIEIGERATLFAADDESQTCNTSKKGPFRVMGFTFRHAVNQHQSGAMCTGASGSILEENIVEWTNGQGIQCTRSDQVIRGNTVRDTGTTGIGGGCDESLIEFNASVRNGWKARQGLKWGFELGGGKFSHMQNTTIRGHYAFSNYGPGIWLDIENEDNVVERSVVDNNQAAGIMLENRTYRTTVRNNVVTRSQWDRFSGNPWTGSGILIQATRQNYILFNTVFLNEGTGVWVRNDQTKRDAGGQNSIFNNIVVNNSTGGNRNKNNKGRVVPTFEIDVATNTNRMDGNIYVNRGGATGKQGAFNWRNRKNKATNDEREMREMSAQESRSLIVKPAERLLEKPQDVTGWKLVRGSAAIDRAVQLPEDLPEVRDDIWGRPRPSQNKDVGAFEM